ncbi:MAG: DUF2007 domain-containing protein [Acidobacteriota bacterium]
MYTPSSRFSASCRQPLSHPSALGVPTDGNQGSVPDRVGVEGEIATSSENELVTIWVPQDPSECAVVEGLLADAGIQFVTRNAQLQNLIGHGQVGGLNPVVGPIEILVAAEDASCARELLEPRCDPAWAGPARDVVEAAEDEISRRVRRLSMASLMLSLLWLAGIGSVLGISFGLRALKLSRVNPGERSPLKLAFPGIVLGVLGLLAMLVSLRQVVP